ncbi:hypothetical protein HDU83_006690 [Entophlyctis luteolus]|nr:hypothetical protein HDU83_006690 [Entophlyctis luteolus]
MSILVLLVALHTVCVSAHFFITSPRPRAGSNDGTELIHPCGGLPLGTRTKIVPDSSGVFPIKGGLAHPTATANFSIVVTNGDPDESQFGQTFFDGRRDAGMKKRKPSYHVGTLRQPSVNRVHRDLNDGIRTIDNFWNIKDAASHSKPDFCDYGHQRIHNHHYHYYNHYYHDYYHDDNDHNHNHNNQNNNLGRNQRQPHHKQPIEPGSSRS